MGLMLSLSKRHVAPFLVFTTLNRVDAAHASVALVMAASRSLFDRNDSTTSAKATFALTEGAAHTVTKPKSSLVEMMDALVIPEPHSAFRPTCVVPTPTSTLVTSPSIVLCSRTPSKAEPHLIP